MLMMRKAINKKSVDDDSHGDDDHDIGRDHDNVDYDSECYKHLALRSCCKISFRVSLI